MYVSLADSCTVVVSGINQFKTACREFRTNEKVDIFNFALCLESENVRDDILEVFLLMFAEPYTFVINRRKFRTAYKLLRMES